MLTRRDRAVGARSTAHSRPSLCSYSRRHAGYTDGAVAVVIAISRCDCHRRHSGDRAGVVTGRGPHY